MGSYHFKRQDTILDTYKSLEVYLSKGKSKTNRPHSNNTRIIKNDDGSISVVLYDTKVITFSYKTIVLNSGGWRTVTTKAKISEFLPGNWHIYQDKGIWYISRGNRWNSMEKMVFFDGMILPNDFKPIEKGKSSKEEIRIKSLIKKINNYCKGLKKAIDNFKIQDPSGGDCWFCCMKEVKTKNHLEI